MVSSAASSGAMGSTPQPGMRSISAVWWWFLLLGVLWTWYGMFVLSYRVGSLTAVAALVGVSFLFGGITQLAVAARAYSWRWLYLVAGILSVVVGITTFVWPAKTLYIVAVLLAWYLIVVGILHLVSALAGPKMPWWWIQLVLGVAELVLGVWAARSAERSLITLVTLVGIWAIAHGVSEIFASFSLREAGRQAERAIG
jgi:uncharacterized membrane protein HdeD (DUF308 family)